MRVTPIPQPGLPAGRLAGASRGIRTVHQRRLLPALLPADVVHLGGAWGAAHVPERRAGVHALPQQIHAEVLSDGLGWVAPSSTPVTEEIFCVRVFSLIIYISFAVRSVWITSWSLQESLLLWWLLFYLWTKTTMVWSLMENTQTALRINCKFRALVRWEVSQHLSLKRWFFCIFC